MRELSAEATGVAAQPIQIVYTLLRDLEGYPNWYPDGARSVAAVERDAEGAAVSVDAVLAAAAGPLRKSFAMRLAVRAQRPTLVSLERLADARGDHEALGIEWRLRELGARGTEITVKMNANLDVPALLPLGSVARDVANGFLNAALARLAQS
ncbi:MAG: SRPBCC family protein [Solirubrobacteraceae bacterium]